LDELIELSTQHILPHFRECWWDHVFLDVILSNTPAIAFGMFCFVSGFMFIAYWLIQKYKIKEYDLFGSKGRAFKDWQIWHW
jgi:phosphatidylserine synthase 2